MDKYSKTLYKILEVFVGVFCILVGLALIGVSIWVSTFSDVASIILIMALLGGGPLINYGVGYGFLGDQYKATHLVRNGRTVFTNVKTPEFLKRRKIVTFIGFISYIVLAVYYVIRMILPKIYANTEQYADYDTSIVALIIYAIISLFIAFVLFMLHKKTKHVDLNEE